MGVMMGGMGGGVAWVYRIPYSFLVKIMFFASLASLYRDVLVMQALNLALNYRDLLVMQA